MLMLSRGIPLAARVGARLQHLRKVRHWSQERLAQEAGYGRATIAQFETGRALPSVDKLIDLARALGVAPSTLLDEELPVESLVPMPCVPLPTWSPQARRALVRSLRQLLADLEEAEPSA